ncbi:hypothetical protein [Amnibacterium setariae]|uniref:Uncharacterized protein n=1 Tax=Amnibacterium setariae TaxID=2306585 RepID=A0A3A1TY00_9MICO|nr:hypothetical protein [Amnibacterium setariae]RIX28640.1 hypothetical protein D1781_14640 [Amnibacterium setariae]
MGQRTIDPLLAEWLPPLHPSRERGERGEFGPQPLIAEGGPDVIVEPAGDEWLRVATWSRGNFQGPVIEGRFDIVQAWMVLFMLRERRRSIGRLDDAGLMRVPSFVPAPDGPLSVVLEDQHTALLVEDGETVARLPDYPFERGGSPQTPRANVLTHIAYIPLPVLLTQLDLPAGGPGSVFRDWSENWGTWKRPRVRQQEREAARLRAAVRALTGI